MNSNQKLILGSVVGLAVLGSLVWASTASASEGDKDEGDGASGSGGTDYSTQTPTALSPTANTTATCFNADGTPKLTKDCPPVDQILALTDVSALPTTGTVLPDGHYCYVFPAGPSGKARYMRVYVSGGKLEVFIWVLKPGWLGGWDFETEQPTGVATGYVVPGGMVIETETSSRDEGKTRQVRRFLPVWGGNTGWRWFKLGSTQGHTGVLQNKCLR